MEKHNYLTMQKELENYRRYLAKDEKELLGAIDVVLKNIKIDLDEHNY